MDTTEFAAPSELRIPGLPRRLLMRVHSADDAFISQAIADRGIWEEDETRLLVELLKPGHVFVDVGANIGYFSVIASTLVGDRGSVLAFEPELRNFELLQENCALNDCNNTTCVCAALGDADTQGTLHLSETNLGDHTILATNHDTPTQSIRILEGAGAVGEMHQRVDCIKIDTQGYERHVLAGLKPMIAASLPELVMLVEFSPVRLRQAGTSGRELIEELGQFPDLHFYLMDHPTRSLLAMTSGELQSLAAFTEQNPVEEESNLVISGRPLDALASFPLRRDLGIFENTLAYLLLNDRLEAWDGTRCDVREHQRHFYLPEGWAFPEDWGRWSQGHCSRIRFLPGQRLRNMDAPRLRVRARYFGDVEPTGLDINGAHLGDYDLRDATLDLPASALAGDYVTLSFSHAAPQRPCDLGDSGDDRLIKLGLEYLAIENSN